MKARLIDCRRMLLAAFLISFASILASQASTSVERSHFFETYLDEVMMLHGLDEESTVNRLAKEALASELYRVIRSMNISGYAGAWFDEESLGLKVAIAAPTTDDFQFLQQIGAKPVLVQHSLRPIATYVG